MMVNFENNTYTLTLRKAADGYVPVWVRLAFNEITRGVLKTGYPFNSEEECANFFRLVTEEGKSEKTMRNDGTVVPLPWKSWADLDVSVLEELLADFFVYCVPNMSESSSLGEGTQRKLRSILLILKSNTSKSTMFHQLAETLPVS